jgi:hypothetical protein
VGLQFPFPFIDVISFPTDASTGTRIVIDGINGRIEFYDASNNLVAVLRSGPTPLQYWGDAAAERVQIEPGQISLYDANNDERLVIITAGPSDPDILYDGLSYGRGVYWSETATADVALSGETIALGHQQIILRDNRHYEVRAQASFNNVSTRVIFRIRYTIDGTAPTLSSPIMEEAVFQTTAVGTTGGTGRIKGKFEPSSDVLFRSILTLQAGAAITALGTSSLQHMTLDVVDLGMGP